MTQRLKLTITDKKHERIGDTHFFTVSARPFSGGPVTFKLQVPNHELNEAKMKEVNECFRNNLRYLKHAGGFPDKDHEDPKAMMQELQKWSSTDTGLAIKPVDDPISQFVPFGL